MRPRNGHSALNPFRQSTSRLFSCRDTLRETAHASIRHALNIFDILTLGIITVRRACQAWGTKIV